MTEILSEQNLENSHENEYTEKKISSVETQICAYGIEFLFLYFLTSFSRSLPPERPKYPNIVCVCVQVHQHACILRIPPMAVKQHVRLA